MAQPSYDSAGARTARTQFLKERVTPVLKEAGFRRSGQTYRYLREERHPVAFWVRAYPMGRHLLELFVDEGLVVRDWDLFIRWTRTRDISEAQRSLPAADEVHADGLVQGRLRFPGRRPQVETGGIWSFDPDDEEIADSFVQQLEADAARYVALADPAELEARLRADSLHAAYFGLPPAPVCLTAILAAQGRVEEARATLAQTTGWFKHEDLAAWVAYRGGGRSETSTGKIAKDSRTWILLFEHVFDRMGAWQHPPHSQRRRSVI